MLLSLNYDKNHIKNDVKIMLSPKSGIYELKLCQDYWALIDEKLLDNHICHLVNSYRTQQTDIERIVTENPVLVIDITCTNCQAYFFPKSLIEFITILKQEEYRCDICALIRNA